MRRILNIPSKCSSFRCLNSGRYSSGAGAFAFIFIGAFVGAFVSTSVLGIVAFLGVILAISTLFLVILGIEAGFAVTFAIAVIVSGGVIYTLLQYLKKRLENQYRISIFWVAYGLGLFLLASIILLNVTSISIIGLLIFYLILPLINAPLDWLSLSITRGLLHSIRHEHHGGWQAFGWALFDVVLALFFLLVVSWVMVLATGLIESVTGHPFLTDALTSFETPETAKNYYWVYAILLTTLIPTLLHFTLAGAALTLWLPHDLRHRIANNLQHNHYKLWAASTYLTITPILGLFAPIALLYGLYLLLVAHGNWLGNMLLGWANLLKGIIL